MPAAPWVMTQTWHDLLFAHWPIEPQALRARVPAELGLDLHDGRAWLGVVPFRMTNVAPRGIRWLPFVSAFPELNVRTYVTCGSRPGVYFFSLDAGSAIAVVLARVLFGLPYFAAAMDVRAGPDGVRYASRRRRGGRASFDARYQPVGEAAAPEPGTLDYFLTERYCLYTVSRSRRVRRVDIHHPRWQLQRAEGEVRADRLVAAAGLRLPAVPPLLRFSKRQDAVAWLPRAVLSRAT